MLPSFLEYLQHILDETEFLVSLAERINKEQFMADETAKRAVARSVEIIGEAAKKVPPVIQQQNPDIEWKAMAGMRDKLIHHYFGVDYDLVWDVVINKIPSLRIQVEKLVAKR